MREFKAIALKFSWRYCAYFEKNCQILQNAVPLGLCKSLISRKCPKIGAKKIL